MSSLLSRKLNRQFVYEVAGVGMSGDITPEKFVEDIDLRRNRVKIYIQRRFDRLAPGRFGLFGGIRIPAMPRKANGLCGSAFKQSGNSNRCDRRRIEAAAQMEADPLRIAQAVFHCRYSPWLMNCQSPPLALEAEFGRVGYKAGDRR